MLILAKYLFDTQRVKMKKQVTIKYEGNRRFSAPYGVDSLDGVHIGDEFQVVLRKARNIKFHKKFFAILNTVHENLPEQVADLLPTVDSMLEDIKHGVGHTERLVSVSTGEVYVKTKSISFSACDQREFEDFVNRAIGYMIKWYFPHDEEFQEFLALSI